MKAKLVLLSSKTSGREFKLALPAKIGRGDDVRLKLMHPLVSRNHCEILQKGETLVVRDNASLNGTFVNDQRVADEMALPSGSRLTVGSANFQVLYGADYDRPPASAPVVQSDAPTKIADETIRMKASAAETVPLQSETKAGFDNRDDLWSIAQTDNAKEKPAKESSESDEFDFTLADDSPKPAAATAKTQAVVKVAAKPAAAKPAAANPAGAKQPAATQPAAKPAGRPPNPAERADDAGKANEKPGDKANDKSQDDDLDDFFKAIM